MYAPRVARRYAQTLFELALEKKSLDAAASELKDLQEALSSSKELRQFVRNPVLTKDAKRQILRALFEKRLNALVFNFLLFLVEKRRLNTIEGICEVFDGLYLKHKNIADIEITSAFPMDKAQVEAITKKLQDKFAKEVRSHVSVDPALIGGIKLKTEDMIYDFSFKTQLEKFRQGIV
jgi:F-type H+-transporting ATPase subunit delta